MNEVYNTQPEQAPQPQKPSNSLVISIIGTVLCWPIGLWGLLKSVKVNSLWASGNHAEAYKAASSARTLGIVSIIVGAIVSVIAFFASFALQMALLDEIDEIDDYYYEDIYEDYDDDDYYYW